MPIWLRRDALWVLGFPLSKIIVCSSRNVTQTSGEQLRQSDAQVAVGPLWDVANTENLAHLDDS